MLTRISLPNDFILMETPTAWELRHNLAGISYVVGDPRSYQGIEAWIAHVERCGNVAPGTFASTINGAFNGQHRQSAASLYGRSPQGTYSRPGGATPLSSRDAYLAVRDALRSGEISVSDASAYYDALIAGTHPLMTHSAYASPSYLGAGYAQQAAYARQAAMARPRAPHAPTTLKSDGMRIGEIIAWRAWFIRDETLHSVVAEGKSWSPTEPMVGDPAAGYGVHAYKEPHGPLLDDYVSKNSAEAWVIGEVALWGDVIEHDEGYRSEFARVHSLRTWQEKVPRLERERLCAKYLKKPPRIELSHD